MGSFLFWNRHRIKRHINNLFELTTLGSFNDMYETLALLTNEIYKFCMLTKLEYKQFEKPLSHIKWSLSHGTVDEWRQKKLRELIKEIHNLLMQHEESLSLYDKIVFIADDLSNNLSLLFSKEGAVREDVLDSFDNFQSMAPEIKEHGFEIFQLYRQVVKSINATKPYLPTEPPSIDAKGRILVRPNEIKDLRSRTGPLLSALGDFIAVFNQPPDPSKDEKKKVEKEEPEAQSPLLMDLDELERKRIFNESVDLITGQNWTFSDTARFLNLTVEELMEIWDLDVIPVAADAEESEEDKSEQDESEEADSKKKKEPESKKKDDADLKPGEKPRPESKELTEFANEKPTEKKIKNKQQEDEAD